MDWVLRIPITFSSRNRQGTSPRIWKLATQFEEARDDKAMRKLYYPFKRWNLANWSFPVEFKDFLRRDEWIWKLLRGFQRGNLIISKESQTTNWSIMMLSERFKVSLAKIKRKSTIFQWMTLLFPIYCLFWTNWDFKIIRKMFSFI